MTSSCVLLRLASLCKPLIEEAGRTVRSVYRSGQLGVVYKGVDDPQTRADRMAQGLIVGHLRRHFPSIVVVAEEQDIPETPCTSDLRNDNEILKLSIPASIAAIKENELVIWVDPVDGTSSFAKGELECVSILIGVAYQGRPIMGFVHLPFERDDGRTIYSIKGCGVHNMLPREVHEGKTLVTTQSHWDDCFDRTLMRIQDIQIMRASGCGHKFQLLMQGRAQAYVYPKPGLKKWDTCACEALLCEIGGHVTSSTGQLIDYSCTEDVDLSQGLLATAPDGPDHSWWLNALISVRSEECSK